MENLQSQIEERINVMAGEVLALVHQAAIEAINQSLHGAAAGPGIAPSPSRRRTTKPQPKRSPQQLQELGELLYQAIDIDPGQGMVVYAEALGFAPRDMGVVVRRLKKAGRVRSVGQRDKMRYFPMDQA